MYLIAIAWIYVVLMMAVAEATSSQGTVLGALMTVLFYGVLPLSILIYIMGTPGRKRARRAQEAQEEKATQEAQQPAAASTLEDGGDKAAGAPVSAVRKEA
jgi:Na+-transporting methylmalonyl-CoA/oxaloacetate decarboxylase gamma subunit